VLVMALDEFPDLAHYPLADLPPDAKYS